MCMTKKKQKIHTIYDRIGKKCISLSKRSTVQLINGLYGKNYPEDSEVTYNWTEHHDDDLRRTLADTIITINDMESYHMEMQMTVDEEIILRVFEYGFGHAIKNRDKDTYVLRFPEPRVIYLCEAERSPDHLKLLILFGEQESYEYRVPVVKFQEMPLEELKQKKLIALLPFQILRLRKEIEKERTPQNMQALKHLIFHDIISSVYENVDVGNISLVESSKLLEMTLKLYKHLYEGYIELEENGMNEMIEDALILETEKFEKKMKVLERTTEELEKKAKELETRKEELETKKEELETKKDDLEKRNQALHMMLKGKSDQEIMEATGFSKEELEELRK